MFNIFNPFQVNQQSSHAKYSTEDHCEIYTSEMLITLKNDTCLKFIRECTSEEKEDLSDVWSEIYEWYFEYTNTKYFLYKTDSTEYLLNRDNIVLIEVSKAIPAS